MALARAATGPGHGDRTAAAPRDAGSVRPVQDLTGDEAPDGRDRATTRIQPTTIGPMGQSRGLADPESDACPATQCRTLPHVPASALGGWLSEWAAVV